MKFQFSLALVAGIVFSTADFSPAHAQASDVVASAPAYVPDLTHQNEPLPDGVFAWDELLKTADTTNGQAFVHFVFNFTNAYKTVTTTWITNITTLTNLVSVTNSSLVFFKKVSQVENYSQVTNIEMMTNSVMLPVTILDVHPSCGCTTVELPSRPWMIPPGGTGQIKLAVNLAGKAGTVFKTANVATDHGKKDLMLRINIAPPPPPRMMSESDRAAAMAAAKIDRQAVFKGDCASCHSPKSPNIYGAELYNSVCAVCHDSEHRAELVPDLKNLKIPTNEEFWRTWISIGKPGSVMPAFAQSQGGPLTDLQIASLAAYLNMQFPSKATNNVGQ